MSSSNDNQSTWPKPSVSVTARMNEPNPALVDHLQNTLPYRALQTHALVTGDHLYHLAPSEPLILIHRFSVPVSRQGKRARWNRQHLATKYGKVAEHHPAAPCGNVILEDLERLRLLGKKVWKSQIKTKEPIEVIVWYASRPDPTPEDLSLRLQRTGVTDDVQSLVQEIHKQMDRSWSGLSNNINSIHSGKAPDNPGSKNSYFAAMVFANSEVRAIGYYILDNILKIAATHPDFNLHHLITLYRELVSVPAEFLGYVGTEFLRDSHRKIDEVIKLNVESNNNHKEAREDLLALVSVLAQYVNLLNAQNLLLFPWKHTFEYPIPTE